MYLLLPTMTGMEANGLKLDVNGQHLSAGDAILLASDTTLTLANGKNAEVLVLDPAA